jgi:hypothetical protein
MLDRLAHEIGMAVIGLILLMIVAYVHHVIEQRLHDRLGRKYVFVELGEIALAIGFVVFVLLWASRH